MLVDDIVARLGAQVAALTGRVQGALELSEMQRQKALPNYTPAGFVVPNGIVARGDGDASANAFLQMVDEVVSVVLVLRTAGDVRGAKTQPQLHTLIWAVINALCGWDPGAGEIGVLSLRRGRIVSFDAGTVFYQLDFAIQDQVRVTS